MSADICLLACRMRRTAKRDQSILYVYWLLDQPLQELENKDLFYPSVEYLEPVYRWLTEYNNRRCCLLG